ncbi:hypothetical protein EVA_15313 [gut metagenome]|uniref:Uncharacterized protein n=1 Tax=gut metagenome TaxID=749906 RepID=J9FNT4_9ZZZZ
MRSGNSTVQFCAGFRQSMDCFVLLSFKGIFSAGKLCFTSGNRLFCLL